MSEQDYQDIIFAFSLPPVLSKVFLLLMEEQRITNEMIHKLTGHPKYTMFRLRKTLNKHDVDVKSKRYFGYWLEPADKQKLVEAAKATLGSNHA